MSDVESETEQLPFYYKSYCINVMINEYFFHHFLIQRKQRQYIVYDTKTYISITILIKIKKFQYLNAFVRYNQTSGTIFLFLLILQHTKYSVIFHMQIVCFFVLLCLTLSEDCRPLYPRIFYNPNPATELKVDMILKFNTYHPCHDSYIDVKFSNSHEEFPCSSELIEIKGPTAAYISQYIHTCSLEIDSTVEVTEFTYTIEGGQDLKEEKTSDITVELSSETLPFRILIAANMDMLNDNLYVSFAKAFQSLISMRETERQEKNRQNNFRINGIALNGGFAQKLSANRGSNYNKIMQMISQYSNRWPLMINLAPSEIKSQEDFSLIEKLFVLGGIGKGSERRAFQGYSFTRKVNLAFIETNSQYFSQKGKESEDYKRMLPSLENFFTNNEVNGNQFSIVLSHYALFCSENTIKDQQESYSCRNGIQNLSKLKELLIAKNKSYHATDLYVGSYQNNYQRTFPFRNGGFMTLEESRYNRGDFINVNEGTGGKGIQDAVASNSNKYIAFKAAGRPGFGILTIKGNAQLKNKNLTAVISKQTIARKIYQSHLTQSSILTKQYLENQNISELSLFLLNYKHISINKNYEMEVEDVFRIVTEPLRNQRHSLRVDNH